ncbi:MAG TPA: AAA family ATPase [Candidatus Paceibacterota bacterium]|nr:AAA family ATPase [Candidatus Paceibacterota bacterium]
MFLSKVELKNFKSFAKEFSLEFPESVTAIVGPNGSGKSNIVDAIRWALGEQSPKNIRIEKNDDLIFAGNKNQPASSFAEVKLGFEGRSNDGDKEAENFVLSRRLNRNGESEYLLNNESAKLKDILLFLTKKQVGVKGFSIVNQGTVEDLLRVSPSNLFLMLEEILGLRFVEIKKEQAKNKIKLTLENLDKAQSLRDEIQPHLRSLKRQVSRFERANEIKNTLENHQKIYFSYYLNLSKIEEETLTVTRDNAQKIADSLAGELTILDTQVQKLQGNGDKSLEEAIIKNDANITNLKAQKTQLMYDLGNLNGQLISWQKILSAQTVKPQLVSLEENVAYSALELKNKLLVISKDIEAALLLEDPTVFKNEVKRILLSVHDFFENKKESKQQETIEPPEEKKVIPPELEDSISKLETQLKELDTQIESYLSEQTDLKNKQALSQKDFREQVRILEVKRNNLDHLQDQLRDLNLELEKNNLKIEDCLRRWQESGYDRAALLDNYPAFLKTADFDLNANSIGDLEGKINRAKQELLEIGSYDQNVVTEFKSVEERDAFLGGQIADLQKAAKDLESLIKELTVKIETDFSRDLKEINIEFDKFFNLIFKGGSAKLVLKKEAGEAAPKFGETLVANSEGDEGGEDNSTEVTNSRTGEDTRINGVFIDIDIPKSKLKGLESLSGGEKALTAIALLFAIVSKAAPPLIILDEIDAALDEENTRRIGVMMKELSSKTQFIVITHNRITMSNAAVIYGVTVDENKTSRILSLRFEEAQKYNKSGEV